MGLISDVLTSDAARTAQEREEAGRVYRDVLLREAKPKHGDDTLLRSAMCTLGRSSADVQRDAALAARIAQAEALSGKVEALTADLQKKHGAWGERQAQFARELAATEANGKAEIEALSIIRSKAEAAMRDAVNAARDLPDLRRHWDTLVRGDAAPASSRTEDPPSVFAPRKPAGPWHVACGRPKPTEEQSEATE